MPNWCNNDVTIYGNSATILLLKQILTEERKPEPNEPTKGVFRTLIGIPPHVTLDAYHNGAWYDANIEYYGTKWDISFSETGFSFDVDDGVLTFGAETAWSPCDMFLENLLRKYKGLTGAEIYYDESGMGLSGFITFTKDDDGNVNRDEKSYDYMEGMFLHNREQFWGEVEYRIDDALDSEDSDEVFEEWLKDLYFLDKEYINQVRDLYQKSKKNIELQKQEEHEQS